MTSTEDTLYTCPELASALIGWLDDGIIDFGSAPVMFAKCTVVVT